VLNQLKPAYTPAVTFQLDPDCSRALPGIQIRFVTVLGLRDPAPLTVASKVFDLDKIAAPVVIEFENGCLTYTGAEHANITPNSRNVVCVIERLAEATSIKRTQRSLFELLRPHADTVIVSVIEPETPRTDLRPDEPAFRI
jgi:hypothetical protein